MHDSHSMKYSSIYEILSGTHVRELWLFKKKLLECITIMVTALQEHIGHQCCVFLLAVITRPSEFSLYEHLWSHYGVNNSEAKIIFLLAGSVRPVKNPVFLLDTLSGQFCEGVEGGVGGTFYQGGGWGGGNCLPLAAGIAQWYSNRFMIERSMLSMLLTL